MHPGRNNPHKCKVEACVIININSILSAEISRFQGKSSSEITKLYFPITHGFNAPVMGRAWSSIEARARNTERTVFSFAVSVYPFTHKMIELGLESVVKFNSYHRDQNIGTLPTTLALCADETHVILVQLFDLKPAFYLFRTALRIHFSIRSDQKNLEILILLTSKVAHMGGFWLSQDPAVPLHPPSQELLLLSPKS